MAGNECDRDSLHKIESTQFYRKRTKLSLTKSKLKHYNQDSCIGTEIPTSCPTEKDTVSGVGTQSQGLHLSEGNRSTKDVTNIPPNLLANEIKYPKDEQIKKKSTLFAMVKEFKTNNELRHKNITSEKEQEIEKKIFSENVIEEPSIDTQIAFIEGTTDAIGCKESNYELIQLPQNHESVQESIEKKNWTSLDHFTKKKETVSEFSLLTQPEISLNGEPEKSIDLLNKNNMNNKIEPIETNSIKESAVKNSMTILKRNMSDAESISNDDDSSVLSSEDSISYLEKCERKRYRNLKFLENQGFFAKVKRKIEDIEDTSHKKYKERAFSCEQAEPKTKFKGMIFSTEQNSNIITSNSFKGNKISSLLTNIEDLESRFPFRSSQIRYLHSLLLSTVRQTKRSPHQTRKSLCIGRSNVYVPSPIFVTGPSGSGKTSVVESIIQSIKQSITHNQLQHFRGHAENQNEQVRIDVADAYIDCGLIETLSLKQLLKNVYKQIKSDFVSSQSAQNTKWFGKEVKSIKTDATHSNNSQATSERKKSQYNPLIDDILKNDYENHVNKGYFGHMDDEDSVDEDNIERQRINQFKFNSTERKHRDHVSKGDARETNPLSFSNSHKTEFSTLGRALTKYCGINRGANRNCCAYLVLDHAEKIFSVNSKSQSSTNQKNADFDNLLTQFLLLPRVVGLNLTIIVISSSNLLGFSRINNIKSHLVSLGTLEDALNPIQIHFHAYRGKAVFKKILSLPKIKELIVGFEKFGVLSAFHEDKHLSENEKSSQSKIMDTIYDSMIDTILQSVEGTTRDIREMIRLSRLLWPEYIKPILHYDEASNHADHEFIFQYLLCVDRDSKLLKERYPNNSSSTNIGTNSTIETTKTVLQEMLHNKARPHVRNLLHKNLLRPGSGNEIVFKSSSESSKNTHHFFAGKGRIQQTQNFPYLTKFFLIAAYLCQVNKSDYDRTLYTNFKGVKRNRKRNDPGCLTHASSSTAQKELNKIRVHSFPLERMLSIFTSILNKYGKDSLIVERCTKSGFIDLRQIGTVSLFTNLAQLQECGLLYQVGNSCNDGKKQLQSSILSSAKFVCTLTKDHAEEIASQIQFPLSSYQFQCGR